MAVTQYIGSRYVPLFADPLEWSSAKTYEPLTIVTYGGDSYTSKQFVPTGIDITDERFWAVTGNYNAQIEQYRRETADARNAVRNVEAIIPATDFDSEHTVKDYIDTTTQQIVDEGLTPISAALPISDFSAENTVKDYIDSVSEMLPASSFSSESTVADALSELQTTVSEELSESYETIFKNKALGSSYAKSDLNYLGRVYRQSYTQSKPQGFCMIDRDLGWFVLTGTASTGSNACTCLKINLRDGEIKDVVSANFAHCNGMAYNKENDKIYVTPNYDYTHSSAPINSVYVCDKSDLTVEAIIPLSFSPHSIAYDKATGKMWITEEVQSPSYHINLYSFDYNTNTATFINTLGFLALTSASNPCVFAKNTPTYPFGYQNMTAYNDILYYLNGGGINAITAISTSGEFIGTINIDPKVFIYTYSEAEAIDFNDDGCMFMWGNGKIITKDIYAVISSVNAFGRTASCYETLFNASREVMYSTVDGSLDPNYNIYQTGYYHSSGHAMFATFAEALAFAVEFKYNLQIRGTVEWKTGISDYPAQFGTISIVAVAGAKLIIPNRKYLSCDLVITGASSSNKLTLQLGTEDTPLTNVALQFYKSLFLRYVDIDCAYTSTYPISNYGIFKSVSVSYSNADNVPKNASNIPYMIHANQTGVSATTFAVYQVGGWVTA